ncbi:MAG TPA: hypothetical protein VE621_12180 [Bryobacteraceae bacterium]|nr:hypothetical protein [Bryobacteraceae bacterium]
MASRWYTEGVVFSGQTRESIHGLYARAVVGRIEFRLRCTNPVTTPVKRFPNNHGTITAIVTAPEGSRRFQPPSAGQKMAGDSTLKDPLARGSGTRS